MSPAAAVNVSRATSSTAAPSSRCSSNPINGCAAASRSVSAGELGRRQIQEAVALEELAFAREQRRAVALGLRAQLAQQRGRELVGARRASRASMTISRLRSRSGNASRYSL